MVDARVYRARWAVHPRVMGPQFIANGLRFSSNAHNTRLRTMPKTALPDEIDVVCRRKGYSGTIFRPVGCLRSLR